MKRARGKTIALLSAGLGITVLAIAGFTMKDAAVEWWYIRKLYSKDLDTRSHAAEKLSEIKSVKAIPRLMELTRTDSPIFAVELVKIGDPAIREILTESQNKDFPFVIEVLRVREKENSAPRIVLAYRSDISINPLCEIGIASSHAPLLKKYLDDPEVPVVLGAINVFKGLGLLGQPAHEITPTLAKLTKHEDPTVRSEATAALEYTVKDFNQ